jgi:hypothetical protein
VVSYDQSKAYGSGLPGAIPHAPWLFLVCRMPPCSQVRTKGGLTAPFTVKSGVRQGDPLVMDALHARFESNPVFPDDCADWGYRLLQADGGNGPLRVCESFFGANCFKLNCSKTVLVSMDDSGGRGPELPSVAGRPGEVVRPSAQGHTFRYLGMWANLDLDWSVQIGRMDRLVWAVCSSIRRNGFDLTMSKTAMDMFLMPALRTGLRVVDAPDRVLKRWDDLLRRAILDGAGISMRRVNVLAFPLVLGFPTLERFRWALRGEELMVTLIADYPCSRTARARRRAVSLARGSRAWARRCAYTRSRDQRTLEGLSASGVFVTDGEFGPAVRSSAQRRRFIPTDPVWSSWTPYVCPIVREVRSPTTRDTGELPRRVVVFTDGSSGKDMSRSEPGQPLDLFSLWKGPR